MDFYLTERGTKGNPDKGDAVIQMNLQTSKNEVQRLNGMLTTLNIFISKYGQHISPFY